MKHFFREMFNDIIGQLWTLLGLTVAWLVLEGTAKVIAGNLILVTLAVWVITYPLRHSKSKEEEELRQAKLERKAAKKAEAKSALKKATKTAARLEEVAELSGLGSSHGQKESPNAETLGVTLESDQEPEFQSTRKQPPLKQ